MNPQLWLMHSNKQFDPVRVGPVIDRPQSVKPYGGLWTSTYDPEHISDWARWCTTEEFRLPRDRVWRGWVLTPRDDVRVYEVDTCDDLERLLAAYGARIHSHTHTWMLRGIQFERLSTRYDAVHLTEQGQAATRFSIPSLYGWDCESTIWFRHCFVNAVPFEAPVKEYVYA